MTNHCELTPEQKKAFNSLKRAIKKCESAGVILWDNYGTIEAVNGHKVTLPVPDSDKSFRYGEDHVGASIESKAFQSGNADDTLYFDLK